MTAPRLTYRPWKRTAIGACAVTVLLGSTPARADEQPPPAARLDAEPPQVVPLDAETPPAALPPAAAPLPQPPATQHRDPESPPEPQFFSELSTPRLKESEHFTIDPVVDGLLVIGGFTFAELTSLIVSTGEIVPQPPGNPDKLLAIDRVAVTQKVDPNADKWSSVGLYAAYGYAILDPMLSGFRDGRNALLVDAIMYAESIAITQTFTNATKIAVRRPRPLDYANCYPPATANPDLCQNTDLQLSFFSGHASTTAAIVGTATYLAFTRSGPHSWRPWVTLTAGTLLTAFVSYERVRSGYHFPTDVIMGSMAGAGIGVLVPHFHRRPHYHAKQLESTPVIIGYAPTANGGQSITFQWKF
jgi:membrane-associated phospholipid phosphatase